MAAWIAASTTLSSSSSAVSSTGQVERPGRAEPVARDALDAGRLRALAHQQRLDPLLDQRREHRVEPGGGAPVRAAFRRHPLEQRLLLRRQVGVHDLAHRLEHLLGRGDALVDVDPAADPLREVRVRLVREGRAQRLVVRADHQVLERAPLEELEQQVGRGLEMPLDLPFDGALETGLRPAARGVLVLHVGVELADLAQRRRAAAEHPRGVAGHEQDAPVPLVLRAHHGLQRGPLADLDARVHGLGQLDRREQVERVRGVEGERAGAVDVEVLVAEEALQPLPVRRERQLRLVGALLPADRRVEIREQRRDLARARGRQGELRRIEVQDEGDDDGLRRLHLGERAQGVIGELIGPHPAAMYPPLRRATTACPPAHRWHDPRVVPTVLHPRGVAQPG